MATVTAGNSVSIRLACRTNSRMGRVPTSGSGGSSKRTPSTRCEAASKVLVHQHCSRKLAGMPPRSTQIAKAHTSPIHSIAATTTSAV